jgi:hypothetical protein
MPPNNALHDMKTLVATAILCLSPLLRAEEPSVAVYQIIEEDMEKGVAWGELILKVNNPTERLFYVFGNDITDIPHNIEVLKNGKWEVLPSRRCGTGMSTRKFLPQSSIVFTADAPLNENDVTFRVRVYLYTEPDVFNLYTEPKRKPWIELLSPQFSTKDFHKKSGERFNLPRLPGVDPVMVPPVIIPETKPGGAPKSSGLEPIPK